MLNIPTAMRGLNIQMQVTTSCQLSVGNATYIWIEQRIRTGECQDMIVIVAESSLET